MAKYQYRPILAKIEESYLENAKTDYKPGFDIEANVRLVIEADTQELADKARIGFIEVRMRKLIED